LFSTADSQGGRNRLESRTTLDLFDAWLAILLTILGTTFTFFHTRSGLRGLRPESLSLLLIWLVGTRVLYKRQHARSYVGPLRNVAQNRLRRALWPLLVFSGGAGMIFMIAPAFANSAKQFASISGWGDSFVGTWLLGSSTALPELITSITACRLGAFDLAVANLYGSCAFNMVVFYFMDLVSPHPIFSLLEPVLALSGVLAVALMLLGVGAIAFRRHIVPDATVRGGVLLASYGLALWIIYAYR
jgi:cation:H+ antiporter